MHMRTVRRGGLIGLVAAASLVAGALPASAAAGDGSAYGLSAEIEVLGHPLVSIDPTPVANADGPTEASLATIEVPGLLRTGVLNASAAHDEMTGQVDSAASVANIEFLGHLAGSIGLVEVDCTAVEAGVSLSTRLVDVDLGNIGPLLENPAPNTVIEIGFDDLLDGAPLPDPGTTTGVLARLIINEQINNGDGSKTVNGLRIELLAEPLGRGEIVVSSATCGPASLPVPLASGAGLWISLGLIGLAVVPVAVVLRRRQAGAVPA